MNGGPVAVVMVLCEGSYCEEQTEEGAGSSHCAYGWLERRTWQRVSSWVGLEAGWTVFELGRVERAGWLLHQDDSLS